VAARRGARRWALGGLALVGLITLAGGAAARHALAHRPAPPPDEARPRRTAPRAAVTTLHTPDTADVRRALELRYAPRLGLAAAEVRRAADTTPGLRIVVALATRRLLVHRDRDTLLRAPVAVGSDTTIAYEGHVWRFRTPRGIRFVRGKQANPVWVPPDWHYVESARASGLRVGRLEYGRSVQLPNGDVLTVRGPVAGLVHPSGVFDTLAEDEEIIFDSTLYIPPLGTRNRRIPGELGRFRLDLGDGYLLHGTRDSASIGKAATHGCVRLRDADVAWLYAHVPPWTPVFIY